MIKSLFSVIVKIIKFPFDVLKKLFLLIFKKRPIKSNFNNFINHVDLLKSRKIDFKAVYSNENEKIELQHVNAKNKREGGEK